jgi:hypothetical protein
MMMMMMMTTTVTRVDEKYKNSIQERLEGDNVSNVVVVDDR